MQTASPRDPFLDVVRAAAILLVLLQHAGGPKWTLFGWIGVDIFFVLSGFLVTRLLLTEHRARGRADAGRFLIRRGFKIYPAFWAMIGVTLWAARAHGRPPRGLAVLSELLFVQNYGPGLWEHTWSLAVEEHFYLLLALLFWRPAAPRWLAENPRRFAMALLAACLAVGAARVGAALFFRADLKLIRFGTHARLDALLAGAALAYAFELRREALRRFVAARGGVLAAAGACALAAGVLVPEKSPFWLLGLSFLPWGFAAFLALGLGAGLSVRLRASAPVRLLAGIGRHSYGIYLWHVPICYFLGAELARRAPLPPGAGPALYFALSLGGGALLSEAVESPFLALRDRLFPSARAAAAPGTLTLAGRGGIAAPGPNS